MDSQPSSDTNAKQHLADGKLKTTTTDAQSNAAVTVPRPAPEQQQAKTSAAETTTESRAQPTTTAKAILREAYMDGNCFFNAACLSLFGNQDHSAQLRKRMFGLLRAIVADQQLYPRQNPEFNNNREAFMDWLREMLFLGGEEGIQTFEEYARRREQDTNWAQVTDSILLAMLLQRPVVVVRPNIERHELLRHAHRWTDERQHVDVYFPDGAYMVHYFVKKCI